MKVISVKFNNNYPQKTPAKYGHFFNSTNQSHTLSINKSNIVSFKSQSQIFDLTSTPEKAQTFIQNLMKNPDELHEKMNNLISQYGLKDFSNWYMSLNGYYGAYQKYMDNLYNNATSLDELFKHVPNWSPWKIEEKAWLLAHPETQKYTPQEKTKIFYDSMVNTRDVNFTIGTAPDMFKSEKELLKVFNIIKNKKFDKNITLDGNSFNIKQLRGGENNDKFIYLINKDDKKIILKMDRYYSEDAQNLDNHPFSLYEKKAIRKMKYLNADSIFTNACMNKYLELNNYQAVPKLLYYNHKENFALYEYINDVNGDSFQTGKMGMEYESLEKVANDYKDLNKLGIFLNDTGYRNFLIDKDGNTKIVDLGHSSFIMPFKPTTKYYNIEFANLGGADFRSAFASMLYSKLASQ